VQKNCLHAQRILCDLIEEQGADRLLNLTDTWLDSEGQDVWIAPRERHVQGTMV
jgi:hypothetical protein